jgi:hypothetical protein
MQLTAVFDGDSASIDVLGEVRSGVAVDTAGFSRTTAFVLRVRRASQEVQAQATVQVAYRNRIRALANAPFAQTNHVAAALPGGGAIDMGGNTSGTPAVHDSTLSQTFEPATEKFERGAELPLSVQAQVFTSMTEIAGGGFALAGTGPNAPVGNLHSVATQTFDPASGRFTRVGNAVTRGTSDRTVTPLADGGFLLTGGMGPSVIPVVSADRYDAAAGQWHATGSMVHVREAHAATLLRDGRVLVTGGVTCCGTDASNPIFISNTAELYDPQSGSFAETGSMAAARFLHAAVLLADGRVLVTGGHGADPAAPPLRTEIYDPATGRFSPAGDLQAARDSHAAVALTDGRILVIGGEVPPALAGVSGKGIPSTEIFDPGTGLWSAGPTLDSSFFAATITMLQSGKVLVFGGQDTGGSPQAAAALVE